MLENIRAHAQGWLAKVILALVTIPFVLFGLDSYLKGSNSDNTLVQVGELSVSQQDFDAEIKNQTQRMRESMGERFDPAMVQAPAFREKLLNSLVDKRVMLQDAQKLKLYAPDSAVAGLLTSIDAFQENGVFSRKLYEAVLRQNGRTPAQFENELRLQLMQQNLTSAVTQGGIAAHESAVQLAQLMAQQREVSWHDIPAATVKAEAPKPEAIDAYYKAHAAEFTVPEAVQVEYLTLDQAGYADKVAVSDDEARAYYKANNASFGDPEQRSASTIVVAFDPKASADTKKKARAAAEKLYEEVKKAPGRFEALARSESQDPVSAANGGSLGTFARGLMEKPVDDAVFSMKVGEIRGPVESQFGYHILRLDSIQPATIEPFDAVRERIVSAVRQEKARKDFPGQAENFSNLVYENADSLEPAAKAIGAAVRKSDWITRAGAVAPFDNKKLADAVFDADAIKTRQNIEALEIAPGQLVSARVVAHRPAAVKPLDEVRAAIVTELQKQQVLAGATDAGKKLVAELATGKESKLGWSNFLVINRQTGGPLDAAGIKAAYQVSVTKVPGYGGYALADGGYRVLRVSRVIAPPLPSEGVLKSIEDTLAGNGMAVDLESWLAVQKRGYEVKVKKDLRDVD